MYKKIFRVYNDNTSKAVVPVEETLSKLDFAKLKFD